MHDDQRFRDKVRDGIDDIHFAELTSADVVRHRLVKAIIRAYDHALEICHAVEAIRLIDRLRAGEANCVTMGADNPDFTGPNSVIDCNGDWTGFEDRRFTGNDLLDCLRKAAAARAEQEKA